MRRFIVLPEQVMTDSFATQLSHEQIAALIPHAGRMCLLRQVAAWDQRQILCLAQSHRDADNPLRSAGVLPITAAIEYAAQAMAVHGALVEPRGTPRRGYLAVLSQVRWSVARFDDCAAPLEVRAVKQTAISGGTSYSFCVSAAGSVLVEGTVVVAFEA